MRRLCHWFTVSPNADFGPSSARFEIKPTLLSISPVARDYKVKDPVRRVRNAGASERRRRIKIHLFGIRKLQGMIQEAQYAMLDARLEYDDHLRAKGHFAAGEALQPPEDGLTLYWKNGKVATTDGPYAEIKEQFGGILVLEPRDLNHPIQLILGASWYEVWALGNATSCGFERNDEGKRTGAGKCRAMSEIGGSKMSVQVLGRQEHRCQKFV